MPTRKMSWSSVVHSFPQADLHHGESWWQPGGGAGLPFPESFLRVLQAASALAKIKAITKKPPEIHSSTHRRICEAWHNIQLTGCVSRLHAFQYTLGLSRFATATANFLRSVPWSLPPFACFY